MATHRSRHRRQLALRLAWRRRGAMVSLSRRAERQWSSAAVRRGLIAWPKRAVWAGRRWHAELQEQGRPRRRALL